MYIEGTSFVQDIDIRPEPCLADQVFIYFLNCRDSSWEYQRSKYKECIQGVYPKECIQGVYQSSVSQQCIKGVFPRNAIK